MPVSADHDIRARCPLGGQAPCFDDLCHVVETTLCGLELDFDFCVHGFVPETCQQCNAEEEDWDATVHSSAEGLGVEVDGG